MDLLSISRAIARYWSVTVPIIMATAVGAVYVAFYQPRLYEATSTYVLLNPATSEDAKSNPYLELPDPSAIVGVLAERINSPTSVDRMVALGASPNFEIGASQEYGAGSRIVDVYAPGFSPEESLATTKVVGEELRTQLLELQRAENVPNRGMIRLVALDPTPIPALKMSSLLRSEIAVIALGFILLFLIIAGARAIEEMRASSARTARGPRRRRSRGSDPGKMRDLGSADTAARNLSYHAGLFEDPVVSDVDGAGSTWSHSDV